MSTRKRKPRDIDQDIRVNELKRKIEEATGQPLTEGGDGTAPPEVEQEFWEGVLAHESAEQTTHAKQLIDAGIRLPSPDSLKDDALHDALWELIRALARRHVYVERTNHLSDRELYTWLLKEGLQEDTPDFPADSGWNFHLDVLGGCSEDDLQLNLKYYADKAERRRWKKDYPKDNIPPHVDPPWDRDRHLPQAEYPGTAGKQTRT